MKVKEILPLIMSPIIIKPPGSDILYHGSVNECPLKYGELEILNISISSDSLDDIYLIIRVSMMCI